MDSYNTLLVFVDERGNEIPELNPFPLTEEEFQTLEDNAKEAGQTLEEFVVQIIKNELEKHKEEVSPL